MTDRCVYGLFRNETTQPFYIGKGYKERMLWHENNFANDPNKHKARIIAKQLRVYGTLYKTVLIEQLTDEEAKILEQIFISEIGRYPSGPLTNLTKGGDGGDLAPEIRAKISTAMQRRMMTDAARERSRRAAQQQWADPVMRAHLTRLVSERDWVPSFRGHRHTDGSRQQMSQSRTGLTHTEQTRALMRENALAQWADPAVKEYRRLRMKGSKPPKSHCEYGHELSGDNLLINRAGVRCCRACGRRRTREYRERKGRQCQTRL